MKIPKKLKIGAHTYTVSFKDRCDCKFGETEVGDLSITIGKDYPRSQQEDTLIHEILHVVRRQLAIELPDRKDEERIITCMATALYQILNDNRMLR